MTSEFEPGSALLSASLLRMAAGGSTPHGFILEGPAHVDKMAVAKAFAMALLCPEKPGQGCGTCPVCHKLLHENHIDLTVIQAGKAENSKVKSVKDADIERLIGRLATKPYDGDRNIGIVESAETMTPRASNRLLKTLEEPPPGTVILLLTDNAQTLPATIRSRCVIERVSVGAADAVPAFTEEARRLIYELVEGAPYYRLKETLDRLNLDKESALAFLDSMEQVYGELLRGHGSRRELFRKEAVYQAIHLVEAAKSDIRDNIGVRYAMMNLLLEIGG